MKLPQRCLLLATALSLMLLTVLPNAVWAQEVPPNAEDEVQTPVGERTVELIELTGTLPVDLTELTVDSPPLFGQYAKLAAVLREQYPAARTFADVKTKRVIAFKEGLPELKILQDSDCGVNSQFEVTPVLTQEQQAELKPLLVAWTKSRHDVQGHVEHRYSPAGLTYIDRSGEQLIVGDKPVGTLLDVTFDLAALKIYRSQQTEARSQAGPAVVARE
jgi:hypothetical protein